MAQIMRIHADKEIKKSAKISLIRVIRGPIIFIPGCAQHA